MFNVWIFFLGTQQHDLKRQNLLERLLDAVKQVRYLKPVVVKVESGLVKGSVIKNL